MTLKIRILRCSRWLFIILVSLTVTLFSEKMLISTRCIHGFMSKSIKKSVTVSSTAVPKREQRLSSHFSKSTILQTQHFSKFCLTYMQLCNCKVDRKSEVITHVTHASDTFQYLACPWLWIYMLQVTMLLEYQA